MEAATFALIDKGLTLLPLLVSAGIDIYNTVEQLKAVNAAAANGTVTDEMLTSIEADFDAKLNEFNSPMPDEGMTT
jgi:hypothetical protein